ncbi:hypothetical protein [Streptomyces sp. NPDC004830]
MRSARMLLATATATAALAIAAPGAYAQVTGDWDDDSTSYSKEHDKHDKHDKPHGGMHTGGGALTAVTSDGDWDSGDDEGKPEDEGSEEQGKPEDQGGHDEQGKDDEQGKEEEHGKHEDHGKEEHGDHEKDSSWGGKHEKPRGGMHTGGGALALVNSDDWEKQDGGYKEDGDSGWSGKHEDDSYADKGDEGYSGKHDKGSWEGKHDKPRGGMHTGGGALANTSGVTAGGLAVLAVAGTGLYALRRRKAAQGVA